MESSRLEAEREKQKQDTRDSLANLTAHLLEKDLVHTIETHEPGSELLSRQVYGYFQRRTQTRADGSLLYHLGAKGHSNLVKEILPTVSVQRIDLTMGLIGACVSENVDLARSLIRNNADLLLNTVPESRSIHTGSVRSLVVTTRSWLPAHLRAAERFYTPSYVTAFAIDFVHRHGLLPYNSNWIPWVHAGDREYLVLAGLVPSAFRDDSFARDLARRTLLHAVSLFSTLIPVLDSIVVDFL